MNRKATKVTVCAVAAAMMLTGSHYNTNAATTVAAFLPAAGLGLVFDEGASISQIREDLKKKKAAQGEGKSRRQKSPAETVETESEEESSETSGSGRKSGTETEAVTPTKVPAPAETQSTEAPSESAKETESTQGTEKESGDTEGSGETGSGAETESGTTEPDIVEAVLPVIKEPETEVSKEELKKEENKETLIIAQVNDYVNIRNKPGTDGEMVGKLYNNSVGTLLSVKDGWYKMKSGNVEGYVKAEYFKSGSEAKKIADEVGNKVATVDTETLKVRSDASLEASVLGLVPGGEELTVIEEKNGFVKVSIEEGDGWVSEDYVVVKTEYVTAESVEEENARIEKEEQAKEDARRAAEAKLRDAEKKREEARKSAEENTQGDIVASDDKGEQQEENRQEISVPDVSSDGSLGSAVASYARQFVGNPYVYGGTSLTNGADCSGFVMSVYRNFGVSLPHSSSADRHVGYNVGSLSAAQPGDLVCYSGHVGIYIGGGQIVHASTEKTGIKISNADYRSPVAIRRIF